VLVGVVVQAGRDKVPTDAVAPGGVTDGYAVVRGHADAPVTVTVYEDFQCPFCREYETALSPTLTRDVDAGDIKVEYRPLAFLDDASSTDYSSRALETAACTLELSGVKRFVSLHALLFENQPEEGGAGLSDSELADLAAQAGADKQAVEKCQSADTYTDWVKVATNEASKDGINATPTYLVDGKALELPSDVADAPQALQDAIDSAGSS